MISVVFFIFNFRFRYQMFATTLSALYGKLLVVMGIAFPMAEVISTYIPPSFYEVSIMSIISCDSVCVLIQFLRFVSGFLFVFIRRQHVIFILYVRDYNMGKTKSNQTAEK